MSALGLQEHLTHRGNLRTSRYGWLRLTPMYSVHLVADLLGARPPRGGRVLDPFCGTGTTALVCAERGARCDTTDINPFLLWLTTVKSHPYTAEDARAALGASSAVVEAACDSARGREWVPSLSNIEKWWESPVLDSLSRAWAEICMAGSVLSEPSTWLLRVAFLRTAIRTARVTFGHQSMSFRQDAGRGAQLSLVQADERVGAVVREWEEELGLVAQSATSPVAKAPRTIRCDARELTRALPRDSYSAVITSPPYCNRMSYIRELRPYMYWLGYLADARAAGELDWMAIGGTWGSATSNVAKWTPDAKIEIPFDGFEELVAAVGRSRGRNANLLARYVAKYFHDTALHARELFEVVAPGGSVYYVVGNSKFYDVLVPTEQLYAAIFRDVGFSDVSVRRLRKRTSKKELFEYLVAAHHP